MNFLGLTALIKKLSASQKSTFEENSIVMQKTIYDINKKEFLPILKAIGTIPENIDHDSSEEKLYSKCTDIVLSKTFQELGLTAMINKERSNNADIFGKSLYHQYSYVADAKSFRLSRTAKNPKDFKVKSMADWKGDCDYAILVCPYYQYPKSNSQIYGQALDGNVCLLSWEHLAFLMEHEIKESKDLNLANIWNFSDTLASMVTVKNKDKNMNFHTKGNEIICKTIGKSIDQLLNSLEKNKKLIVERGQEGITFWEKRIEKIKNYSKEKAISELISSMKIYEKISSIKKYIYSLV
ncbi:HindIII family type II restriction endonuclease [Leptospira gomenensis]|uniref:HindIII family type II restriction endonuclease n=1 Tax=Leptospira gomenensis TaxID=2484974 RepID=UPI00108460CC|nr:HindIII family type II restriction endonuclease [Leptospira gomenensis]TGK59776.1 HindIII family type II restriction endonuclease [Leptospira gomenensis]